MLYIGAMSNSNRSYSYWTSASFVEQLVWGVGSGLAVVCCGLVLGRAQVGVPWRVCIAALPLIPSLFYIRAVARWIRGLDEMQRLIQLQAMGFTLSALILTAVLCSLLQRGGMLAHWKWEWESLFVTTMCWYALGGFLARRRYQ